ncbi:MAG: hypothetical protein HYX39_04465 [Bacteroidetes bacterium]|nr:hypothetical protein [Bacteroidota bacterium]
MKITYKRTILKLLITTLVISSLFTNCRKPKTVEVEKKIYEHDTIKTSWSEYKKLQFGYNFQKIIASSFSNHPLILFYSPDFSFVYDSITKQWGSYPSPNFTFADPLVRAPQINKNVCFSTSVVSGRFSVFCPYQSSVIPSYGVPPFSQYFSTIDTSFSTIVFNSGGDGWFNSSAAILSDSDRVMVPVRSKQNNNEFYVFDINPNNNINYAVQNFNKITYTGSNSIYVIGTFGNRFLFQTPTNGPSLMRSNFTVKSLGMPTVIFINPFVFEGKVYCADSNSGKMYVSSDLGENWTVIYTYVPTNIKYFIIKNKIIGVFFDKLYDVTMNSSFIEFKELKNDGFENNKISSIITINNTVYISTTKGVFTKDYSNFYNYK